MRKAAVLATVVLIALACVLMDVAGSNTAQESPAPAAPLALVAGAAVNLAWQLPASPRPISVVVFRRTPGAQYTEIATVDAESLGYADAGVSQGLIYEYAIALLQRRMPRSAISDPTSVKVGVSDIVTFRGGSISRAIFDVALFVKGRKYTETFVHAAGEVIGDLRRVDGVDDPLDFRVGCKLDLLRLEIAPGKNIARDVIQDARGKPMLDLAGKPVSLKFPAPGETRERLVAELTTGDGRTVTLAEGEGCSP